MNGLVGDDGQLRWYEINKALREQMAVYGNKVGSESCAAIVWCRPSYHKLLESVGAGEVGGEGGRRLDAWIPQQVPLHRPFSVLPSARPPLLQVVGIPVTTSPVFLFYHKPVFARDNLTVPVTWEQVLALAERYNGTGARMAECKCDALYCMHVYRTRKRRA